MMDTKKRDTWMPLYIGDYLADTSRLTTEQHGAYLLLLMDYWRNGPPPNDPVVLASITKMSVSAWKKSAATVLQFFDIEDGRLFQRRAEEERARAGVVSSKRSEAGRAGAAKRWGKETRDTHPERDGENVATDMANAMANAMAEPSRGQWQNGRQSQSQCTRPPQRAASTPQPEVHEDALAAAPPDAITHRAIEITVLLRPRGAALQAGDPRIREWASNGVTDAEVLQALETAQRRRHEAGDRTPINAGYLDAILRAPGARAGPATREDSRRIAASSRLSDYRAACAAEQRMGDDDGATINGTAARLVG